MKTIVDRRQQLTSVKTTNPKPMNEIERFKIWKLRVKQECKRCRWPKSLIQTIDWEAWRIQFYDDEMTPEEAVECEMDCMMQNG